MRGYRTPDGVRNTNDSDPDLTCPWGKTYTPGNPKGRPNLPECDDPRSEQARAVREWVGLVERGRTGK